MSQAVELLLTLFAMLSAVTGAFSGVREQEAQVHQAGATTAAQAAVSVVEEAAERVDTAIPENPLPSTEVRALPTFSIATAVPLYADRLIE